MNTPNLPSAQQGEKPWRKEGANMEDFFNFGFDESSWTVFQKHHSFMASLAVACETVKKLQPYLGRCKAPPDPRKVPNPNANAAPRATDPRRKEKPEPLLVYPQRPKTPQSSKPSPSTQQLARHKMHPSRMANHRRANEPYRAARGESYRRSHSAVSNMDGNRRDDRMTKGCSATHGGRSGGKDGNGNRNRHTSYDNRNTNRNKHRSTSPPRAPMVKKGSKRTNWRNETESGYPTSKAHGKRHNQHGTGSIGPGRWSRPSWLKEEYRAAARRGGRLAMEVEGRRYGGGGVRKEEGTFKRGRGRGRGRDYRGGGGGRTRGGGRGRGR